MTEAISPDLKIEPFGSHHNRAGFACSVKSLDRYFKTQANQDVKRKINGVFVLVDPREPTEVLGYYIHLVCDRARARGRTCGCPQARPALSLPSWAVWPSQVINKGRDWMHSCSRMR